MATRSFFKLFPVVVVRRCLRLMKAIAIVFLLMFPAVDAARIDVFNVCFLLFLLSTLRLLDVSFKIVLFVDVRSRRLIN